MNKAAKMATGTTAILMIVVAVLAYMLLSPGQTPDVNVDNNICSKEDTAFTPKMTRLGKAGTSLSTGYNYFILTDSIGNVSAATATTVDSNADLKIMFGEDSTTYYTKVLDASVNCEDPFFFPVQLALADTSLNTFYMKNSDGTVNSESADESLGADDTSEMTVYLKAGVDSYFGNPDSSCKNIAVVEFDKTNFRSVTGEDPVGVPGSFSATNSTYDGSTAFYIPKTGDGKEVTFEIIVESTSTQPTDSTYNPILHVYDCDIDKNEDTLELIHGVEDEDLNAIDLVDASLTLAFD